MFTMCTYGNTSDSRRYNPEKPSQSGWNAGELQLVGSYTTEDSVPPQDAIT